MTKIIQRNKSAAYTASLCLAVSLLAGHKVIAQDNSATSARNEVHFNIWKLIEILDKAQPVQASELESTLHLKMEVDPSTNQYTLFWTTTESGLNSQPIARLSDGIYITDVLLAIDPDNRNDPSRLTINIKGSCITKKDVQSHYPGMILVGHPMGHSINEETTYDALISSGTITFGFAERAPECLSSIGFGPRR